MATAAQLDTHLTAGGTVKVQTMLKGEIDVPEANIIDFVKPLIGFPDTSRYVIYQTDPGPLYWLQSVDDLQTSFCLIAPFKAGIDVDMAIGPFDAAAIGAREPQEIDVYTLVVFGKTRAETRTNLRAPVLVNAASGKAVQIILDDPALPIQYPLGGSLGGAKQR